MRAYVFLAGAALSVLGILLDVDVVRSAPDQEAPAPQQADAKPEGAAAKPDAKPDVAVDQKQSAEKQDAKAEKSAATPASADKPEAKKTATKPARVPEKYAADEKAIREIHSAVIKAYSSDDAKGVASHFAPEAEYINALGSAFEGPQEIEESLAESMAEHPNCKLESEIDSIRFVSPTLALVDATVTVTHAEEEAQNEQTICHSSLAFLKTNDKWQIASVRDQHEASFPKHEDQLAQLHFLIGDWVDEHDGSELVFSCRLDDNEKFLLRDFTLKIAGRDVLSGTQRIGWDPASRKLRTWIFDSEGGFAEGIWQRSADGWEVKTAGVTADGDIATGTSIYTIINDHTMKWQAVDHEVGGENVPDSPVFTLSHRAPEPSASDVAPAVGQTK